MARLVVSGYSSGSLACSCAATSGRPAANASASFTTWWKTSVLRKPSSADALSSAVRVWFERYADDAVLHCVTERQARQVLAALRDRLVEVGLQLARDPCTGS